MVDGEVGAVGALVGLVPAFLGEALLLNVKIEELPDTERGSGGHGSTGGHGVTADDGAAAAREGQG